MGSDPGDTLMRVNKWTTAVHFVLSTYPTPTIVPDDHFERKSLTGFSKFDKPAGLFSQQGPLGGARYQVSGVLVDYDSVFEMQAAAPLNRSS